MAVPRTFSAERGPFDHRPPRVLLALVTGSVALVGTAAAAHRQPAARPLDLLGVALLLVSPVVLATIPRRQVTATALSVGSLFAFLVLGYPWGPVFLPVVGVLVAVLLSGPAARGRVVAWSGAAALLVAALVADLVREEDAAPVLLLVAAAWSCAALFAAGTVRERASRIGLQRRAEGERAEAAATAERLRIARDLHDVLAHSLSAINVQAGVGLHLLDREPEQARAALRSIRDTSGRALDDVRGVLGIVRSRQPGGLADLAALAAPLHSAGIDVMVELPAEPVAGAAAEAAYRVVQEALTNVGRHAASVTSVDVRLAVLDGVLEVSVTDDGGPAGEPHHVGYGLVGMRERVEALGGAVEAGPGPLGFAVHARIPLALGRAR